MADLSSLLESGLLSDLEVICGSKTFKVHKIILCSQCDFFKNALNFKEGETGKVELPEDNPDAVKATIEYMYTGDYKPSDAPIDGDALVFHAKVYAIACKYLIQSLQALAASRIESFVPGVWDDSKFPEVIATVYEAGFPGPSQSMKAEILSTVRKNIKELIKKTEFMAVVGDEGEFAQDVLSEVSTKPPVELLPLRLECRSCHQRFTMDETNYHNNNWYCPNCSRSWTRDSWKQNSRYTD